MSDNVLIANDITVELGSAYVGSAYSPQASVTQTDTGWELTITYADPDTPGELATLTIPVDSAGFGEVTASVESGHGTPQVTVTESGPDTAKSFHFAFSGIGGFSPTITVTEIEHGHRVTVTDVDGTESFDVLDGDPSQAIEDAERAAALANAAAATADASAAAADTATAAAQAATTAAQGATSAAQTATGAANTATGRANTASTSATSAASAAQTATTAAQTATTAADTAADNAQDAADRANAAAAGITDAYSPMFTAGAAEGITGGGPSDTASWMYRACPGTDGPATIESIHGNTVVESGELLSVQMEGIESDDADGNVLMERTIPAATYFPNGMRSAGSVYDELTESAAVTRVGSVDLGTLKWMAATDSVGQYFRAPLANRFPPNSTAALPYAICPRYSPAPASNVANGTFAISSSVSVDGYIFIRDSTYIDAATFKAAMSGVMLHYALAIPTTTTIDPPLNLTYKAASGGTERITHTEQSAPPIIAIAYGYTAESLLAAAASTLADPDGPTATTNHAVGSYLTMGGTLYRVTTAIAAGETVTPGTNVTATTVMAEVVSLIQ